MPQAFTEAISAYQREAAIRSRALDDSEVEAAERRVDELFRTMVRTPARTIGNTLAKGRAMLSEYGGCGELRTDLVECLVADLAELN